MLSLDKMVRMIKAKTDYRTNDQIGASCGISGQAVHNMTKSNNAKISTLQAMASACNVTISEMLSWGEE